LLSDNSLFLAVDQWKALNYTADKLEYKKIYKKGSQNSVSFKSSKIKLPKKNQIKNKIIYDITTSIQMTNFVRALTGINHYSVDSCESHLYEEGDFFSPEWAKINFQASEYVFCLFLDGSYTGGDHVVNKPGGKENIYTPKSGEILIASCDCCHEVKPVISGKRRLVLACIQPLIGIDPHVA